MKNAKLQFVGFATDVWREATCWWTLMRAIFEAQGFSVLQ